MKVFLSLLLAVASQAAPAPEADPLLYSTGVYGHPYAGVYGYPYAPVHTALTYGTAVHTGNAVPVAVGGYKAEAGCNGDLCGPVHAVPGVVGALATETQESSGAVKLTTGTGHLVHTPVLTHYGKREADAAVVAPAVVSPLVYGAHYPYAGIGHFGYAGLPLAHSVVPATQAVTYKTYTPTVETKVVATNLPVPVAVGGYKAVAGDNGDLKGAVHQVPAIFGAPALNVQVNDASQGSLTVGTSAVVTHTVGEPIVKEHTVNVPLVYGGIHSLGKREAEADPYVYFGGYGHGLGYGYGYPSYYSHGYTGLHGYSGYHY